MFIRTIRQKCECRPYIYIYINTHSVGYMPARLMYPINNGTHGHTPLSWAFRPVWKTKKKRRKRHFLRRESTIGVILYDNILISSCGISYKLSNNYNNIKYSPTNILLLLFYFCHKPTLSNTTGTITRFFNNEIDIIPLLRYVFHMIEILTELL